jgi:hypothetical protein
MFYKCRRIERISFHLRASMKTGHLKRENVDKVREYYDRLEALVRDCLENDEFRLAWGVIRAETRITHSSRKYAEQAGVACIRGLGVAFDGIGFAARQNKNKRGWRIRFFIAPLPVDGKAV